MQKLFLLLSTLMLLITTGCFREPEGPAERLGKTIDQLNENLQELAQDFDTKKEEEDRVRERERVRVRDDYYDVKKDPYGDRERDRSNSTQERY